MAAADEEAWFAGLYPPEPGGGFWPAGWREWLHEIFVARGPLELDEVERMARSIVEERAEHACRLVAADAAATLSEPVAISTVGAEWSVRVIVDGHTVPGVPLRSWGAAELTVEVADGVQPEIMDNWQVWPVCPHHDAGLHPELRHGEAVWYCRRYDHAVGRVGQLGAATTLS